jgi:hypothetical protein
VALELLRLCDHMAWIDDRLVVIPQAGCEYPEGVGMIIGNQAVLIADDHMRRIDAVTLSHCDPNLEVTKSGCFPSWKTKGEMKLVADVIPGIQNRSFYANKNRAKVNGFFPAGS